jgi:hypothetical protein
VLSDSKHAPCSSLQRDLRSARSSTTPAMSTPLVPPMPEVKVPPEYADVVEHLKEDEFVSAVLLMVWQNSAACSLKKVSN